MVLLPVSESLWKLAFSSYLTVHLNDQWFQFSNAWLNRTLPWFEHQGESFSSRSFILHAVTRNCDFISMLVCSRYHFKFENEIPGRYLWSRCMLVEHKTLKISLTVIEDLLPDLQMEVIDLQSNDILSQFKEENLIEFSKFLPGRNAEINFP